MFNISNHMEPDNLTNTDTPTNHRNTLTQKDINIDLSWSIIKTKINVPDKVGPPTVRCF